MHWANRVQLVWGRSIELSEKRSRIPVHLSKSEESFRYANMEKSEILLLAFDCWCRLIGWSVFRLLTPTLLSSGLKSIGIFPSAICSVTARTLSGVRKLVNYGRLLIAQMHSSKSAARGAFATSIA